MKRGGVPPWILAVFWLLVACLARWPGRGQPTPTPERTAAWLAGVAAAPLAGVAGVALAGPSTGAWAAGLVALSAIHALASRGGRSETLLVLVELLGLAGLGWLERSRRRWAWTSGLATLAAQAAWLLSYAPEAWAPETTAWRLVRCSGASLTRVLGIEYELVVPHARYALPLTALFVALALRGAGRLAALARWVLVAGAALPFALGAVLALASGNVAALQAQRLAAALPFWALLVASGLASLAPTRAWAAGAAVLGSLAAFLALALVR
jgi:hypothetical protein